MYFQVLAFFPIRTVVLGLWLFAAVGCTQLTPTPSLVDTHSVWQTRVDRLSHQSHWKIRASVAGTSGDESFSTRFQWIQDEDQYAIQLFDPIGRVVAKINGDQEGVEVRTSKGQHYTDRNASDLIRRLFHIELPVEGLRYWALGISDPAHTEVQVQLDEHGLASRLRDDGWDIQYERYMLFTSEWLPEKFELTYGDTRLKIDVGLWELP